MTIYKNRLEAVVPQVSQVPQVPEVPHVPEVPQIPQVLYFDPYLYYVVQFNESN